jgi:short-subunit dehydrogenase
VISGATEGLGLEMCNQLAAHGFNICLISRNQAKIDTRIRELQEKHPSTVFKGVQLDCAATDQTVATYEAMIQ